MQPRNTSVEKATVYKDLEIRHRSSKPSKRLHELLFGSPFAFIRKLIIVGGFVVSGCPTSLIQLPSLNPADRQTVALLEQNLHGRGCAAVGVCSLYKLGQSSLLIVDLLLHRVNLVAAARKGEPTASPSRRCEARSSHQLGQSLVVRLQLRESFQFGRHRG